MAREKKIDMVVLGLLSHESLTGYDINGNLVSMKDLNFDWWLGDKTTGVLATLDNYHNQEKEIRRIELNP